MTPTTQQVVFERIHFTQLFTALLNKGYQVIGPVLKDGAIVYDQLNSADDLPIGYIDEQDGGAYRLKKQEEQSLFGYVVGPHAWKKFLFPSALRLWSARRSDKGFSITAEEAVSPKFAFLGVRSCDIHAISIQDKVFTGGQYTDASYKSRRKDVFILAVNCGRSAGTCFCASMNTGPKATFGFDLAVTEIIEGNAHYFLTEAGSERGAEMLREIPTRIARKEEVETAGGLLQATADNMKRRLDVTNIKDLLYRNSEHPRWDVVAARCLTCANCTMVCPTCFCTTVEDVTGLTGEHAERWRKWDSCFTRDFSYIHGGSVRQSAKSRYRQWMTHKLASWTDQFGTSGCVGCGRCITWCPVGIDVTEEVRAIRESDPIATKQSTPCSGEK